MNFKYILFLFLILNSLFLIPSSAHAEEKLYFIHQDHLGSTSMVTDEQGNVISKQNYYPYGSTRHQSPVTSRQSLITEHQYTSQVSDVSQTGLYYYNARYYSPQIALFNQADTKNSDGLNRYFYVGGSPVNYTDPTGHCKGIGCWFEDLIKKIGEVLVNRNQVYQNQYGMSDQSYKSDYFFNLLEDFLDNNQKYNNHLTGNYTDMEKLYTLNLIFTSSGLFQTSNIITNPSLSKIQSLFQQGYLNNSQYNDLMNMLEEGRTIQEISNYAQVFISNNEDISPQQLHEIGGFLCSNFTDLYSTYAQEYIPDIPIYATGIPGHAFTIVDIDGAFYVIDSSPGFDSPFPIPILTYIDYRSKELELWRWRMIDYNPEVSSPLASKNRFNDLRSQIFSYLDSIGKQY